MCVHDDDADAASTAGIASIRYRSLLADPDALAQVRRPGRDGTGKAPVAPEAFYPRP